MSTAIILVAILAVVVLWFISTYNGLVGWRNRVKDSWSQIDVQLKRRYDLIPNLVETVKGYAKHEQSVFENVTKASAASMQAQGVEQTAQAENQLSQTLKSLFAVTENYPELKANQNFMALQEELSSTENKISFARQFYNDSVMEYNTRIQRIPGNLVAGIGNFQPEPFFQVGSPEERQAVKVQFS